MTKLKRIPVRIEGDWQPVAYVGHVDWKGTATADEPITGLALSRTPDGIDWARVRRGHSHSLDISLHIRPDDDDHSRYRVWVWFSMQPTGVPRGQGQVILRQRYQLTSTAPFMFTHNHVAT